MVFVLSSDYELWLTNTGAQALDVAIETVYINTITCTDSNNEVSNPLELTVEVIPNEQVTVNNVEGAGSKLCSSFVCFLFSSFISFFSSRYYLVIESCC